MYKNETELRGHTSNHELPQSQDDNEVFAIATNLAKERTFYNARN